MWRRCVFKIPGQRGEYRHHHFRTGWSVEGKTLVMSLIPNTCSFLPPPFSFSGVCHFPLPWNVVGRPRKRTEREKGASGRIRKRWLLLLSILFRGALFLSFLSLSRALPGGYRILLGNEEPTKNHRDTCVSRNDTGFFSFPKYSASVILPTLVFFFLFLPHFPNRVRHEDDFFFPKIMLQRSVAP